MRQAWRGGVTRPLLPGDRVRLVSPSSPPTRELVERGAALFAGWGLEVEIGAHAFDRFGHYLAGTDADRLADLNSALRDPRVRAIIATRGGKGAYRIAHAIDFAAARADPKPLVGYSETTILHLSLWANAGVAGLHGPHAEWLEDHYGQGGAESLRRALMDPQPITIQQDPDSLTAAVRTSGRAEGILLGGNLDMLRTSVGWACPSFDGAILFVEAIDMAIGALDRAITQLLRSGVLAGVRGIAIGQFIRTGDTAPGKWSAADVLSDRLGSLGVPVLGGLPMGHGPSPVTLPLGTRAVLDVDRRTLTVDAVDGGNSMR